MLPRRHSGSNDHAPQIDRERGSGVRSRDAPDVELAVVPLIHKHAPHELRAITPASASPGYHRSLLSATTPYDCPWAPPKLLLPRLELTASVAGIK